MEIARARCQDAEKPERPLPVEVVMPPRGLEQLSTNSKNYGRNKRDHRA